MLAAAISNKTLYGGNVGRPSFKGMLLKKYLIMALNNLLKEGRPMFPP